VCLAPAGLLGISVGGLSLLFTTPFTSRIGLLGQSLTGVLPGSSLGASLGNVLDQVGDFARQAKKGHGKAPTDADPSPLPTPVPAPLPAPPAPAEQSGGSSVSANSHNHHKGGGSHAVLSGALLVLYLRPLALARLARSSGYSRSFRPLVLPG